MLPASFYQRDTLVVAEELLGKFLVRRKNGKIIARMITEVEAYDGFKDRASHAHQGKTDRNKVMFEEGGRWYVYLCYGMHWMLNIATGPKDYPAAVLVRGIEGVSGPGRVTKFLNINGRYNGSLAHTRSGLWIENRGAVVSKSRIKKTPRIGVSYAGPMWAKKHYRFVLRGV